jgi:hypothetical protein
MFWDLVTLLAFLCTWAYLNELTKKITELRKDIDDLMTFNRIARYHALNDEKIKSREASDDERKA